MKRLLFWVLPISLSLVSHRASAQSLTSDVFGGFSYLRGSRNLISGTNKSPTLTGWQAEYTLRFIPRFGITASATGDYGPIALPTSTGRIIHPSYQQYTFLAGPDLTILKSTRLEAHVRGLGGAVHADDSNLRFISARSNGYRYGDTAFAAALGGNLDINLTKHFSYRVIQPEYLLTRFGTSVQSNLRASTGIVFLFGR